MLVKKIKFKDFFGKEREQEFYFHMSEAEAQMLDLKTVGGFERKLKTMTEELDVPKFAEMLNSMILSSYGKISDDGFAFEKTEEATKRFQESNAYSIIFKELITDGDACVNFIKGILPQELQDRVNEAIKNGDLKLEGSPEKVVSIQ